MTKMTVIEGREYDWLNDFLGRIAMGDHNVTNDDYDTISGIIERTSCCERCERVYNEMALEEMGYEKKGGVSRG